MAVHPSRRCVGLTESVPIEQDLAQVSIFLLLSWASSRLSAIAQARPRTRRWGRSLSLKYYDPMDVEYSVYFEFLSIVVFPCPESRIFIPRSGCEDPGP